MRGILQLLVVALASVTALLGGVVGYSLGQRPQPTPTSRTITSTIDSITGLLLYGICEAASSTRECVNAELLTQDDDRWSNWTMIVVAGQPARCVRGFDQARHSLTWPEPLTGSAAYEKFVVIAAEECRPRG